MTHFKISLIKSITPLAIFITATSFGLAEILDILEEVYDKKKEN